ncbi:kinase-like protein, partial [Basidiobolus meristosporus CBS 931.73]
INSYIYQKTIGIGSSCRVKLCRKFQAGKECEYVVIKEVPLKNVDTSNGHEKIFQESNILASVSHPNIIGYKESFIENGYLCIVTEYADGGKQIGDLHSLIQKRREYFEEDQIMSWFTQIALALSHIHNMNIIHRDVKTQNIFTTNKRKVIKVGDFGISRILQGTEKAQTMIGMAKSQVELILNMSTYDQKTDIWALGCVLYELCSLQHPFIAKDIKTLVGKISENNYIPLPRQYSSDIRYLVSWMLSYETVKRPDIGEVL